MDVFRTSDAHWEDTRISTKSNERLMNVMFHFCVNVINVVNKSLEGISFLKKPAGAIHISTTLTKLYCELKEKRESFLTMKRF